MESVFNFIQNEPFAGIALLCLLFTASLWWRLEKRFDSFKEDIERIEKDVHELEVQVSGMSRTLGVIEGEVKVILNGKG